MGLFISQTWFLYYRERAITINGRKVAKQKKKPLQEREINKTNKKSEKKSSISLEINKRAIAIMINGSKKPQYCYRH